MLYLRLYLLLGMIFHKIVWEVLKRRDSVPMAGRRVETQGFKLVLKSAKSAVLVFFLIQTLFLNIFPILSEPFYLQLAGLLIFTLGLGIAVSARIQLGQNWANLEDYGVIPEQRLVHRGIYSYIRHPIYTGDLLLILGLQLALNSWLVLGVIILAGVIIRQAIAEETVLDKTFPDYGDYRRKTKMFIPFVI